MTAMGGKREKYLVRPIPSFAAFRFTSLYCGWHDQRAQMSARLLRHVDEYLAIAQDAGASDVHLGVNAPPVWRLHGTLQPIWPDAPRFNAEQTQKLADAFLNDTQRQLVNERGDADFAYANSRGRYRASVVRQRLGTDIVFRIINTRVRTMDELGLPE